MSAPSPEPGDDPRVRRGLDAQLRVRRELLALGLARVGWKVGLTDPAVREKLALDAPVVGFVTGENVYRTGEGVPLDPMGRYRVEVEIALTLASDVDPDASLTRVRDAIGTLAPAIEIVDYRRAGLDLEGIVAHNVFHAGAILNGPGVALRAVVPEELTARALRNGRLERSLDPTLRPRDLAALTRHVARSLAPHGEALRAGDRILTGSLVQPLPVSPGDRIRAEIDQLGALEARFTSAS